MLPVIEELFTLLNFETMDLLTDNLEWEFGIFMILFIYDTNVHRFQRLF